MRRNSSIGGTDAQGWWTEMTKQTTDLRGGKFQYECVAHMGDLNPILLTVRADNSTRAKAVVRDYVTMVLSHPIPKRVDVTRIGTKSPDRTKDSYRRRPTEESWVIRTTISRQTGLPITTGRADVVGLDPGNEAFPTPWYTICDEHGMAVGHATKSLARDWASEPTGWCEVCSGQAESCDQHNELAEHQPQATEI